MFATIWGKCKRKVSEGVEPSLAESESAVITVRPRNHERYDLDYWKHKTQLASKFATLHAPVSAPQSQTDASTAQVCLTLD